MPTVVGVPAAPAFPATVRAPTTVATRLEAGVLADIGRRARGRRSPAPATVTCSTTTSWEQSTLLAAGAGAGSIGR